MIKAVCFDLDGTLVDSEWLYLEGNVDAGRQLGYRLTFEAFLPLVGVSEAQFKRQLDQLIAPSQQAAFARLTQVYVDGRIAQPQSLAQPGADHLLTFLQAHHIKLALVTTSTAEYTQRMLTNTGWRNVFEVIVTREQGRTKPAPDLYLQALNQLKLANDQVLAVEDSPVGVHAAKVAKLKCIQVQDLAPLAAHADQQIDHLFALEKILRA